MLRKIRENKINVKMLFIIYNVEKFYSFNAIDIFILRNAFMYSIT